MSARITVPLGNPVTVDGVRYKALHLRKVKATDRRNVRGDTRLEAGLNLAARLAGVPPTVICALDDDDREAVGTMTSRLLG